MAREILFRGKTIQDEWIYGSYVTLHGGRFAYIFTGENSFKPHSVFPETVGQYTGLTDKNGTKIFEGDIVKGRHWAQKLDDGPDKFHEWRVDWSEKSGLIVFKDSPTSTARLSVHDFLDFGEVEVIGNIHDGRVQ